MTDYQPIDDEMLWGVPPEELQQGAAERNFFDEHQPLGDQNAYDDFYQSEI